MTIVDPNASASESRIGDAISALKGDSNAREAVDTGSVVTDEDLEDGVVEDNVLDSLFGEGNQSESSAAKDGEDSRQDDSGAEEATTESSDVEEILVRGPDGKKKKISVDFSNREQILKNAKMAAGARKWQAERDRALSELDKVKGHTDKAEKFDTIAESYEAGGPLAALQAMLGDQEAEQWLQDQFQKFTYREGASEEELKYLDAQERAEKRERELEAIKRRQEEFEQKVQSEREKAEVAELQSLVNPVFDKYRFAGKLGDPSQEHDLDEIVWTRATKALKQAEEKGLKITREIADKAFRQASNKIRKFVNVQSEKKAEGKVKRTKEKALANAQVKAQRGFAASEDSEKARDMIKRGDISGFFKSFGKNIKL